MRRIPPAAGVIAGAAVVLFAFVVGNGPEARAEFPLDDAWIHLDYARGLVRDGAPTYNPGEPEAGFSSAAWIVALLPSLLVANPPAALALAVKLTTLLFAMGASWASARLAARMVPEAQRDAAMTLGAALPWLSPGFAFASVSGMEVSLTACVAALALDAVLAERVRASALLLGVLPWCRPEGAVVSVVGWCALTLAAPSPAARVRRGALAALPGLALGAMWVGWCVYVAGRPLPNTFYAKAGDGALASRVAYWFHGVLLAPGALTAAALTALVAYALVGASKHRTQRRAALVVGASAALPVAAIVATHGLHRGVLFYEQRYFLPFTALVAPLAAAGASHLAKLLVSRGIRAPLALATPAVVLALLASPAWLAARESYADHCADIRRLHVQPALDAAAQTPSDTVLAVEGAGASRFFAGPRRVIDLLGLNTHGLAGVDQRVRFCVVLRSGVRVVIVPSDWMPAFDELYRTQTLATYTTPRWSVTAAHRPRAVVTAAVAPRPEALRWMDSHFDADCHPRTSRTP